MQKTQHASYEINKLMLVTEPKLLATSYQNIRSALNRATSKGTYDLTEAGQLFNDINTIGQLLDQIIKLCPKETLMET